MPHFFKLFIRCANDQTWRFNEGLGWNLFCLINVRNHYSYQNREQDCNLYWTCWCHLVSVFAPNDLSDLAKMLWNINRHWTIKMTPKMLDCYILNLKCRSTTIFVYTFILYIIKEYMVNVVVVRVVHRQSELIFFLLFFPQAFEKNSNSTNNITVTP